MGGLLLSPRPWLASLRLDNGEYKLMAILNMVPEFIDDDSVVKGTEETVQPVNPITDEVTEKEKETPAEPPAVETPASSEPNKSEQSVDTSDLTNQIQGLQEERVKLLREIQSLRGQKRELKKEELFKIDQKVDELKDVHPDDVALIDKVLRQKGYITRDEASKMAYESVKNEELNKFLEKYPEYKTDNDPNDLNWNTLQRELGLYRMPDDPKRIGEILERAHKGIVNVSSDRTLEIKKQQLKTAGVGSQGVQKSSSRKTFDPEKRVMLRHGGFTDEDIARMESRL